MTYLNDYFIVLLSNDFVTYLNDYFIVLLSNEMNLATKRNSRSYDRTRNSLRKIYGFDFVGAEKILSTCATSFIVRFVRMISGVQSENETDFKLNYY